MFSSTILGGVPPSVTDFSTEGASPLLQDDLNGVAARQLLHTMRADAATKLRQAQELHPPGHPVVQAAQLELFQALDRIQKAQSAHSHGGGRLSFGHVGKFSAKEAVKLDSSSRSNTHLWTWALSVQVAATANGSTDPQLYRTVIMRSLDPVMVAAVENYENRRNTTLWSKDLMRFVVKQFFYLQDQTGVSFTQAFLTVVKSDTESYVSFLVRCSKIGDLLHQRQEDIVARFNSNVEADKKYLLVLGHGKTLLERASLLDMTATPSTAPDPSKQGRVPSGHAALTAQVNHLQSTVNQLAHDRETPRFRSSSSRSMYRTTGRSGPASNSSGACVLCGEMGHLGASCTVVCRVCRAKDHKMEDCLLDTSKPCFSCSRPGHIQKACIQALLRKKWGSQRSTSGARRMGDVHMLQRSTEQQDFQTANVAETGTLEEQREDP